MEAISNIIGLYNQNQHHKINQVECEDSESQEKQSNQDTIFTSKEIQERGYKYSKDPEPPKRCKYCGKDLYQKGVVMPMMDRVVAWISHERCTCKKATDYWERYDNKQQEIAERERLEEESRKKRERIEKLLGNSGIKKRFKNRTFENFEIDQGNKDAYKNSKLYAENFQRFKETGEGIYFSGGFGTGKTHLAVSIALDLINKGTPVICMTAIDLLAQIRKTYDKDRNVSEYQILQVYKEVDLLVIDDLGKEYCSDWAATMLYDIINDRYESCLPTIVTTNYDDENLVDRLARKSNYETAGAIVSRLHEMTMGITMNGEDRRKRI
ncbi:ATP-binding protein [Clostridium formicaceticum]|nr:ATP-binding protein [Clostridium formicaceticum]